MVSGSFILYNNGGNMREKKLEFKVSEFACHCNYSDCNCKEQSLSSIEPMRTMVNYAMNKFGSFKDYLRTTYKTEDCVIIVSSGARCTKWNTEKRGEPDSDHLYNKPNVVAADLQIFINKKQLPDEEAMRHLHLYFGNAIRYMAPTTKRGAVHVSLKVVK